MIAIDTETCLITDACKVPRLVCLTVYDGRAGATIHTELDACRRFLGLVEVEQPLVGHNVAYDIAVCVEECYRLDPGLGERVHRAVWAKYFEGGILCTKILEMLEYVASGAMQDHGVRKKDPFTLQTLVARYLGEHLEKEDTWRLRYEELLGMPLVDWPEEARTYALDDAVYTWRVADVMLGRHVVYEKMMEEWGAQSRAAYALHLQGAQGARIDQLRAHTIRESVRARKAEAQEALLRAGLMRAAGNDVVRDMGAIRTRVASAYGVQGLPAPRTDPSDRHESGQIATSADVIEQAAISDPVLAELTRYVHEEKMESTYLDVLCANEYIHPSWNPIVATGRTSCSKPNMQNLPRGDDIRECVIPREGFVLCVLDYVTAELCTLAQTCLDLFGRSAMADALIAGRDPHSELAAQLMGVPYTEFFERLKAGDKKCKETRHVAKAANFGYPGGLGDDTFLTYAGGMGVSVPEGISPKVWARSLKESWLAKWPEMSHYFSYINKVSKEGKIVQIPSGRIRGKVSYCAAANTLFQGRSADGAKHALSMISRDCYVGELSPSRLILFVHDEFVLEVPDVSPHLYARRLEELAIQGMQKYTPDIPVRVDTKLCDRWSKSAETAFDSEGNLAVWKK